MRAHAPGRGLGHQPHARGRLPAARRAVGGCAGPGPDGRRRARCGRVRAARAARAERAASGGDGIGGAARHGLARPRPRVSARSGSRCCVLLLLDPWLVRSLGFVLSSLATAGILFLGPPFRDALRAWLPRWAAEAVAVPLAAQIACTPVVAAVSEQVSLVAVPANLLAAVAVGPATVLGLLGGLILLVGARARPRLRLARRDVRLVDRRRRHPPRAAADRRAGLVARGRLPLAVLGVLCLVVGLGAGRVLRRPRWSVPLCVALVVVMLRPLPTPGLAARGWVMVACDVGQGDGLVLNAGRGAAVVVDTGPDPQLDGAVPEPARRARAAGRRAHPLPRRPRRRPAGCARRPPRR